MRFVRFLFIAVLCLAPLAQAQMVAFNSPLVDAANNGDESSVLVLLGQGNKVDSHGDYGVTPLIRAAYNGHLRIVKILLDMGADPNATDIAGATALHIAARQGKQDVVEALLHHHANLNAVDNEGWTPLMRASLAKQVAIARLLIDQGADTTLVNQRGDSAAVIAAQSGSADMLKLWAEHNPGGNPTPENAALATPVEEEKVETGVPVIPVAVAPEPVLSKPAFLAYEDAPVMDPSLSVTPLDSAPLPLRETIAEQAARLEETPQAPIKAASPPPAPNRQFFRLQLGLYKNHQEAEASWRSFAQHYPQWFAKQHKAIMRLQGQAAESYTLVTGKFAERPLADKRCVALWKKDIGCFVMQTALTLAQLDAANAPTQLAAAPALSFDPVMAAREEALADEPVGPPAPPVPVQEIAGLPWLVPERRALPKAKEVDSAKVIAAGQQIARRETRRITPQRKPAPPVPEGPVQEAPVQEAPAQPSVEAAAPKKGKVEIAEAIHVKPGQKLVFPKAAIAKKQEVIPASAASAPAMGWNIAGKEAAFWIQVGNFATQQTAIEFANMIRQNEKFHGARLRVVRLPEEAAKQEPSIALQLGRFPTERKAVSMCKSDLSYMRCTVIRDVAS